MYIDKTLFQRVVFVLFSIILAMGITMISHECGCEKCKEENNEVVEENMQQPVVNITYIVIEAPKCEEEPEKVEPEEEVITYFDVPLSAELQEHIIKQCEERGIDPTIVLAMIKQESNFNVDAMGDDGNAYGLMQIWPYWHSHRMEQYGCDDLRDPFQNVTVGIDIIADYIDKGYGVEWALMAYNGGGAYADRKLEAGEVSEYAQRVMAYAESLKGDRA